MSLLVKYLNVNFRRSAAMAFPALGLIIVSMVLQTACAKKATEGNSNLCSSEFVADYNVMNFYVGTDQKKAAIQLIVDQTALYSTGLKKGTLKVDTKEDRDSKLTALQAGLKELTPIHNQCLSAESKYGTQSCLAYSNVEKKNQAVSMSAYADICSKVKKSVLSVNDSIVKIQSIK